MLLKIIIFAHNCAVCGTWDGCAMQFCEVRAIKDVTLNLIPLHAANKGIGYEIARQLAAEGLKTIVTARNGVRSMPKHAAAMTDVVRA